MISMTNTSIAENTREFIKKNFIFDDKKTLGDEESLLGTGVVDSTGILELIAFLEESYQLKFRDNELVADNFDSVTKITAFVSKKLSDSSTAGNAEGTR
jgi:acyl carrier protein